MSHRHSMASDMTVREWYAGQAMHAMISNENCFSANDFRDIASKIRAGKPIADAAYAIADMMIQAFAENPQ